MAEQPTPQEELPENEAFTTLDEEFEEVLDAIPIGGDGASTPKQSPKKLYILIAILSLLALVTLGLLTMIYTKKKSEKEEQNATRTIIEDLDQAQKKLQKKVTTPPNYETLAKKADQLYQEGKKEEALKIHRQLAQFNEALSQYNLGVVQLKKGSYQEALKTFSLASREPRLRFESFLNSAICAYKISDRKAFAQNLAKAKEVLVDKSKTPLYSYYHALLDYYQGFFAEALVPLQNPSSHFYKKRQEQLSAKLFTLTQNNQAAINALERDQKENNAFTLGLLYAKEANYEIAKRYLLQAQQNHPAKKAVSPTVALALVDLKSHSFKEAAMHLDSARKRAPDLSKKLYPIKAELKASLFDPDQAQKEFEESIFMDDLHRFSLLFTYAPYQIMRPSNSVTSIKQGVKYIYIDALQPAYKRLDLAQEKSNSNLQAVSGIKALIKGDLFESSHIFQEGLKRYPNSSALHFDLALNEAKLYHFHKALKLFQKSALLDHENYLAAIFAKYCAKLTYQKQTHHSADENLEDKISKSTLTQQTKDRLLALLDLYEPTIKKAQVKQSDKNLFDGIIALTQASINQDHVNYRTISQALKQQSPHDLILSILDLDAHHDKKQIKAYAKAIQERFGNSPIIDPKLYDGSVLTRELYTRILAIAGIVPTWEKIASKQVAQHPNSIGALQALAFAKLYTSDMEGAYKLYNHLIDDLKIHDSHTLFLGAVAAIGSQHHANAIALLELAKLSNKSNMESRYALGLLYHENQNLEAAAIEYKKIGDLAFQSRFFDFHLQHP